MAFPSKEDKDAKRESERRSVFMTMMFHLGRTFRVAINTNSGTGSLSIPKPIMDELKIVKGDDFYAIPFNGKEGVQHMLDNGVLDEKKGVVYIRKETKA